MIRLEFWAHRLVSDKFVRSTAFECLLRSSWFAIMYKVIAYLKEQITVVAFTSGKDTQSLSEKSSWVVV